MSFISSHPLLPYDVTLPRGAMLQVVCSMEPLAMAATFFQRVSGIAAAYAFGSNC